MKFKIDHDLHIHSHLSLCSNDSAQNTSRILEYAKNAGLSKICLTDHFWDATVSGGETDFYIRQNLEHIRQALPLPSYEGVEFLFGAETDMDRFCTMGVSLPCFDNFDFVIIPTTHLHMVGFTITPEDAQSNRRIAELWVERLDQLLDQPLPFGKIGIAHLACSLINNRSRADYVETLSMIPDEDMERVFTKAARVGCGIELNRFDVAAPDEEVDTVFRMFRIAKACGCKFYLGGDAHHPKSLESAIPVFRRAIDLLDLTEEDKFHIQGKE